MNRLAIIFVLGLGLSLTAETRSIEISRWLVLGPLDIPNAEAQTFANADAVLDYPFLQMSSLKPREGLAVEWGLQERKKWDVADQLTFASGQRPQVLFWAAYLETSRWLQAELIIDDAPPLRLYLDGKLLKTEAAGKEVRSVLNLANGKHLLLGQFLLNMPGGSAFRPRWFLKNKEKFSTDSVAVSFTPSRRVNFFDVLHTRQVTSLAVSPDGGMAAVFFSRQPADEKSPQRWMEILATRDGRNLFLFSDITEGGTFAWMRDSRSFAFTRSEGEKTSVYVYSLADQQIKTVCRGIDRFSSCWWDTGGQYLVYSQYHDDPDAGKGFRFVREIPDRARAPHYRYSLTMLLTASGVRHRLADEKENYSDAVISPDGSKIVISKTREDPQQRPYARRIFTLVGARTLQKEQLVEDPWLNSVVWSPDSRQLLFLGGPSAFKGLGKSLPESLIPNEYDIQAYLFDLSTRKAQALSRIFDPSIDSAFWSPADKQVYFKVTDQDCTRLYRYSPAGRTFQKLEAPVDAVPLLSFSDRKTAVFWGSGPANPPKLYVVDLSANSFRLLADPNRDHFADVRWGRVAREYLKTEAKKNMLGTLYYPPDYDPARKYPCIVNFYGGATPVLRDYGGRYPKEWYAANGYLVLVLQPSGATGFGQENSALHVNDWGEATSTEIIAAVAEALRTHPEIDAKRLGAIGASYGGFLTQYLATRTDLFAAYVSHAGISSLASYWGVGDWGYSYSAVASAGSFPWNRKDIYVGHSPLFLAERITRPLLLLHGDADNNVPPGESYQMYAALKMLGKAVALVTFADQQHFILEPEKRIRWMNTIIAWFDRWLKNQPEWWEELYPDRR